MLKDISPGETQSNPAGFMVLGGVIYFSAGDETHGWELWKSDGTAAGTVMVRDINAINGSDSGPFGEVNGESHLPRRKPRQGARTLAHRGNGRDDRPDQGPLSGR